MLKLLIDVYNKSKSSTEEEKKRRRRKKREKRKKEVSNFVPQVKRDNEASFRALPKAIGKVNVR